MPTFRSWWRCWNSDGMAAGGHFDERLEKLACALASVHDLAAVVSVHAEIIALIDDILIGPGPRSNRVELGRRARELKRSAETVAGELLISMQVRGLRRGNGGDQRTAEGRSRVSIADLGFRWRTTTSRWQRRARGVSPSFNRRLAEADTVEAIKALIAEATLEGRHALKRKDQAGYTVAVAQRMAAKRRGGALLLADRAAAAGLNAATARSWRRLARLSDGDFRAAVESGTEDPGHCARTQPAQHVVMVQTEWSTDRQGVQRRRVYAVESPAATPSPQ